jgi:transcriptional regulator with PAS, ATPase and Fis domain
MAAHERKQPVDLAGIGSCPAFLAVVEQARELARIPRPILIRGERGTGKEPSTAF